MAGSASVPDYQWPPRLLSAPYAPLRLALAAVFHVGRWIGLLMRAVRRDVPGVLVIRTDGIGDGILFEPALTSLGDRFPHEPLHLWAPSATCELFSAHPSVSRLTPIPRGAKSGNLGYFTSPFWRARMGYLMGRWKFDVAVYAVHSPEPLGNWVLTSVDAAERWYAPGDTENQFDWQRQRTHDRSSVLLRAGAAGHELHRNGQLARQWDAPTLPQVPRIFFTDEAIQKGQRQAKVWRGAAAGAGARHIVGIMAASATDVNRYPLSSWASVAQRLWNDDRAICVLLGGPGDQRFINQLRQEIGIPILSLESSGRLLANLALIRRLDALIAVDTGLAHGAAAQDVPTVVLGNGGHPGRFFPWPMPRRCVVLSHRVPCEGCLCRCKLNEPECVTRIDPEGVAAACANFLRRQSPVRTAA
jgi:ADP-heptose:LPS heptosyltransferase